jgi:Uma2 family endonuclease
MALSTLRHAFTVADYHRMAEAGILDEDARVELLEGEIVDLAPIGRRHQGCVDSLTEWFILRLSGRAIVRVLGSIFLGEHSEPQPDLVLLRRRADFHRSVGARPEDVLLIVEVADSSLAHDRDVKVPLYARAGIPEAWVVNLPEECIEVYSDPAGGQYQTVGSYARGRRLQSHTLASLRLSVAKVLG